MATIYFDDKKVKLLDNIDYSIKKKSGKNENNSVSPTAQILNNIKKESDNRVEFPKQTGEIGDAIEKLNSDTLDVTTGMSDIDTRARLHKVENDAILVIDFLVSSHVLPRSMLSLTRQKKRLSVSVDGKGRQEIVEIATGMQNMAERKGIFSRLKDAVFPPKIN